MCFNADVVYCAICVTPSTLSSARININTSTHPFSREIVAHYERAKHMPAVVCQCDDDKCGNRMSLTSNICRYVYYRHTEMQSHSTRCDAICARDQRFFGAYIGRRSDNTENRSDLMWPHTMLLSSNEACTHKAHTLSHTLCPLSILRAPHRLSIKMQ